MSVALWLGLASIVILSGYLLREACIYIKSREDEMEARRLDINRRMRAIEADRAARVERHGRS